MTVIDVTRAVPHVVFRSPRLLIDLVPGARIRTFVAVVGFALLTAGAAQVEFKLGFTPVPVTGQTFAVLLTGAVLGWKAGTASQFLYVCLGAAGLPFYADGDGGWKAATGATAGYLVGFVVAAAAVGYLAERKQDRSLTTSWPAMLAGSAIIYACGVGWLAHDLNIPIYDPENAVNAINLGLAPFVIGDLVKLLLVGALLPGAWKLFGTRAPVGISPK